MPPLPDEPSPLVVERSQGCYAGCLDRRMLQQARCLCATRISLAISLGGFLLITLLAPRPKSSCKWVPGTLRLQPCGSQMRIRMKPGLSGNGEKYLAVLLDRSSREQLGTIFAISFPYTGLLVVGTPTGGFLRL